MSAQILDREEYIEQAYFYRTLSERLREATQRFDQSHPTLSRVVGNLLDVLGQMGI